MKSADKQKAGRRDPQISRTERGTAWWIFSSSDRRSRGRGSAAGRHTPTKIVGRSDGGGDAEGIGRDLRDPGARRRDGRGVKAGGFGRDPTALPKGRNGARRKGLGREGDERGRLGPDEARKEVLLTGELKRGGRGLEVRE